MAKFRKKPVVIEAVQYDGYEASIATFVDRDFESPFHNPAVVYKQSGGECLISTLEGAMVAKPGDWIIRGVKGELYPCKPDIFAATYEPV